MKVRWHHRDKCPDCGWFVWTQTDSSRTGRPNLKCQCICGATIVEKNKTTKGGGAVVDEMKFEAEIRLRNFEPELVDEGHGPIEIERRRWQRQA